MRVSRVRKMAREIRAWNNIFILRMLLGTPFRMIFGNDAGFRENVRGRNQIVTASQSAPQDFSRDQRAVQLKSEGFLKLNYPYDQKLVMQIKDKYLELISEKEKMGEADMHEVKPTLLFIPESKFLLTTELSNLIRTYYEGGYFSVKRVESWRNYYWGERGLTKNVVANLPHNDQTDIGILKIFVFLSDDVTRNNGATKIFKINDTKRIMRSGYFIRNFILWPANRITKNQNKINFMEGNTGFSFIFNPQLALHQAGLVADTRTRDVIVISVQPSSSPLQQDWEEVIIQEGLDNLKKLEM
jgi:hypothetical protein